MKKEVIGFIVGLIACSAAAGQWQRIGTISDVGTGASAGSAVTNSGMLDGYIYAVSLDVGESVDYETTNTVATTPSAVGMWFNSGTYASSNYYIEDGGSLYLFYTNASWYIATNVGCITTYAWTNEALLGVYATNGPLCTGAVEVISYTAPDFDIDIEVTADDQATVSRTVLSVDDVTADVMYYPREIAEGTDGADISNEPILIPLAGSTVRAHAFDADTSNTSVRVDILLVE